MNYLLCTLLVGTGATAVIDLWAIARKRLLGIPSLDYGLLGRWLVHMAHYLIGMAFAAVLLAIWGLEWARHPRPSAARLQSLITHAIFGLGLYEAGWLTSFVQR